MDSDTVEVEDDRWNRDVSEAIGDGMVKERAVETPVRRREARYWEQSLGKELTILGNETRRDETRGRRWGANDSLKDI